MLSVQRLAILMFSLITVFYLTGCTQDTSRIPDEKILRIMQDPDNLPYNYWQGESKWELKEKGASMFGSGHLSFGRRFQKGTEWGVLHRELMMSTSRLKNKPLLLLPVLDSNDPDVVLYSLESYDRNADEIKKISFSETYPLYEKLRKLAGTYPDVRVRWKAINLMTDELHWGTVADMTKAMDDPAESVRLQAVEYLDSKRLILSFEKKYAKIINRDINTPNILDALIKLSIKHLNDNHHNVRFTCSQALKSLVNDSEYYGVKIKSDIPVILTPNQIKFDWMRESWWKRNDAKKELLDWWNQAVKTEIIN